LRAKRRRRQACAAPLTGGGGVDRHAKRHGHSRAVVGAAGHVHLLQGREDLLGVREGETNPRGRFQRRIKKGLALQNIRRQQSLATHSVQRHISHPKAKLYLAERAPARGNTHRGDNVFGALAHERSRAVGLQPFVDARL
jgi:hypothetical protein